jgi:hypothetical protein
LQHQSEQALKSHQMNKSTFLTIGIILVSSAFSALLATPLPPDPSLIPIDGGVSLLVAVCVGYGVKKIYDSRKDSNIQPK